MSSGHEKFLKAGDTVNLIKTGCNKVYADSVNLFNGCTTRIENIQAEVESLVGASINIDTYFAMSRTGKLYQTKIPKYSNGLTTQVCTKTLDNLGLNCVPCTDSSIVENIVDDYINIPLFKWWRCNYHRESDTTAIIDAIEGVVDSNDPYYGFEDGADVNGYNDGTCTKDVGTFGMSFYYSYIDGADDTYSSLQLDSNYYYLTISDSPNAKWGLQIWPDCVDGNGNIKSYWCYSTYFSGNQTGDGLLRSQKGLLPTCWMSYNNLITNYRQKGSGYTGAGIGRHLLGYIFYMIKYANKGSKNNLYGCLNYNYQYNAANTTLTNVSYFPVTDTQASNLIIGSCVSVGNSYVSNNAEARDRGNSNTYSKVANAIISNKEKVSGEDFTRIYLVNQAGNPVTISDTAESTSDNVTLHTIVSTKPWVSGSTDKVYGKHDGSLGSNLNGKYPFRIQGIEYMIGAWTVISDTIMNINSDYSTDFYTAQKGVPHVTSESDIKNNYVLSGTMSSAVGGSTSFWIGDLLLKRTSASKTISDKTYNNSVITFYPISRGTGNTVGVGDYCYRNTSTGLRETLLNGGLYNVFHGGLCSLDCVTSPGSANWNIAAAD